MRISCSYIDSNNSRATEQFQFEMNSLEYNEFKWQIGNSSCPFRFPEEPKTLPLSKLFKDSKSEVGPRVSKRHHGAWEDKVALRDGNYFIYCMPLALEGQVDNFYINCY